MPQWTEARRSASVTPRSGGMAGPASRSVDGDSLTPRSHRVWEYAAAGGILDRGPRRANLPGARDGRQDTSPPNRDARREMIVEHRTLQCRTRGIDHSVVLTEPLQAAIGETGVATGQAAVLVQGSTAALTTLEFEPGLVNHDIAAAMERLAPRDGRYLHEETWHDDIGHSHVRASTMGPSLALPIVDGRIPLGTWQQFVLVDFDTRPRDRTVHVSVVGVAG